MAGLEEGRLGEWLSQKRITWDQRPLSRAWGRPWDLGLGTHTHLLPGPGHSEMGCH